MTGRPVAIPPTVSNQRVGGDNPTPNDERSCIEYGSLVYYSILEEDVPRVIIDGRALVVLGQIVRNKAARGACRRPAGRRNPLRVPQNSSW